MINRNSYSILVDSENKPEAQILRRKSSSFWGQLRNKFVIRIEELPFYLLSSMVPPFVGTKFKQIHVDLIGPAVTIFSLSCILYYGHLKSGKVLQEGMLSPLACLISYIFLMPVVIYLLGKVGRSWLGFFEVVALFGYSLFGHVLTLLVSFLFYSDNSLVVFFCSMVFFGGLATARLVLILLTSMPIPAAQLVVCSVVGVTHLLFLIFIHFIYMHKTFVYGGN